MLNSDSEDQLAWFSDLMPCAEGLFLSVYSTRWQLFRSTCPDHLQRYWDLVFRASEAPRYVEPLLLNGGNPVIFSAAVDLTWIIVPNRNRGRLQNYAVLGPLFLSTMSAEELEQALNRFHFQKISPREYLDHLNDLPSLQYPSFLLLGKMLNRTLNGETLDYTEFQLASPKSLTVRPEERLTCDLLVESSHGRSDIEDLLLEQIKSGNLNYRTDIPSLQLGQYGELAPGSTLRQLKDEFIIATTLCSRAAMEGGLSRQQSLSLADSYIRQAEAADTIAELMAIYDPMVDDYIRRVHFIRQKKDYSPAVRSCINYIEEHIGEPLSIRSVAEGTGYTGYYLSALFRRETGMPLGDYMKKRKVEHAKRRLLRSNAPVASIAEEFGFASPSHFSAVFRDLTGCSPTEFRRSGGNP